MDESQVNPILSPLEVSPTTVLVNKEALHHTEDTQSTHQQLIEVEEPVSDINGLDISSMDVVVEGIILNTRQDVDPKTENQNVIIIPGKHDARNTVSLENISTPELASPPVKDVAGNKLLVERWSRPVTLEQSSSKGNRPGVEDTDHPHIYKPSGPSISEPVDPQYLKEVFAELPVRTPPPAPGEDELAANMRKRLLAFMGPDLTEDQFDKLSSYCSADNLRTPKDLVIENDFAPTNNPLYSSKRSVFAPRPIPPDAKPLRTLQCLHERQQRDANGRYSILLKYRSVRLSTMQKATDSPKEPDLEPGAEVLYRLRIYRPFACPFTNKLAKSTTKLSTRHPMFHRDLVLLGRQRLSELRDHIFCPNDFGLRTDMSERPNDTIDTSAKELFPSGFFFIDNKFYNDMRAPSACDYSEQVRAWATRRGIGGFRHARMEHTRLDSLTVRLGHPEVYVHQGSCEHLFTFSEVRLLGPRDPLASSCYPTHTAFSPMHSVYCTVCAEFVATWVVVGCQRLPFHPAQICQTCYQLYLFKDGHKIDNFKSYKLYTHDI